MQIFVNFFNLVSKICVSLHQQIIVKMYDTLHIDELCNTLKYRTQISSKDIADFYRSYSPDMPISTIRWKIYSLVDKGIIYPIGRGVYQLGRKTIFEPNIYRKTEEIANIMHRRLPFASYCQWDLSVANAFVHHLLNTQLFFVDVERDAAEAAYYGIRAAYRRTVLYRNISEELPYYDGYIVVRNMAIGAPTIKVSDLPMASLEKILVDFAIDRLFPFQNTEIVEIYANATASYAVNTSRMLRYAGRRGRRNIIEEILDETS